MSRDFCYMQVPWQYKVMMSLACLMGLCYDVIKLAVFPSDMTV